MTGSLIDPNAVTQIAAPNRIQREGASRRPFTSAPVRPGPYYRGPMPSLNNSNSMLYAQQFSHSQSPFHLNNGLSHPSACGRTSRPGRSSQVPSSLESERAPYSRFPNGSNQLQSMQPASQHFEQEIPFQRQENLPEGGAVQDSFRTQSSIEVQ